MTIYFITDGCSVKIGYTKDKNPEKRLKQLQTGNAKPLALLGFIPGDITIEKAIHSDLDAYREQGEWFTLCPDVSDYVRKKIQTKAKVAVLPRRKEKPKGFGRVELHKVLSKDQRNDILKATPSILSFVDTEDGTMVVPSELLRDAIKNRTPLDAVYLDCGSSATTNEDKVSGVEAWMTVANNWAEFQLLGKERQQDIVAIIVEDVYPQIRAHITDILQEEIDCQDFPLIPIIALTRNEKNKGTCEIKVSVYPYKKYLTTNNQHLARYLAQFGTFPMAINMGKDANGHDVLLFTPIIDNDMTSLGWQN